MTFDFLRRLTRSRWTSRIRGVHEGTGPLYRRRYSVEFPAPIASARATLAELAAEPNLFSPQLLASFEKTKGAASDLKVGDEFLIHISGPWDGPVVVASKEIEVIALKTLDGHLESGDVEFRVLEIAPGRSRFEIASRARSSDSVIDFVYDKIPIARFAQTHMWKSFCRTFAERACARAGQDGSSIGATSVTTLKRRPGSTEWESVG